jgi:hypothetical protein
VNALNYPYRIAVYISQIRTTGVFFGFFDFMFLSHNKGGQNEMIIHICTILHSSYKYTFFAEIYTYKKNTCYSPFA